MEMTLSQIIAAQRVEIALMRAAAEIGALQVAPPWARWELACALAHQGADVDRLTVDQLRHHVNGITRWAQ